MKICPEERKVSELFNALKSTSKKASNMMIPIFAFLFMSFALLVPVLGSIMDSMKSVDFDDVLPLLPVFLIIGAVIGLIVKPFLSTLTMKGNAELISQIRETGIEIENELVTGKMLKMVQPTNTNMRETLPRKAFDVTLKVSNISNIEVNEKVIGKVNYGKMCTITSGGEQYYLMCLSDEDLTKLKSLF